MRLQHLYLSYVEGNSLLHQLPLSTKFLLLLLYLWVAFSVNKALLLLILLLLIILLTIFVRLPLRFPLFVVGITGLLLVTVLRTATPGASLLLGVAKIVILLLLVALFTMTTRTQQILQSVAGSPSGLRRRQLAYLAATTLTALPIVQRDLQRAIDAETLRRGKAIHLHSFRAWMTILVVVLVRSLVRAEWMAASVVDRGFVLERGLVPLYDSAPTISDYTKTLLLGCPGILIYWLT